VNALEGKGLRGLGGCWRQGAEMTAAEQRSCDDHLGRLAARGMEVPIPQDPGKLAKLRGDAPPEPPQKAGTCRLKRGDLLHTRCKFW
jgi:hypothetical protein